MIDRLSPYRTNHENEKRSRQHKVEANRGGVVKRG